MSQSVFTALAPKRVVSPLLESLDRNLEMVPLIMLDQVTSDASTLVRIIASRRVPNIWNGVQAILV